MSSDSNSPVAGSPADRVLVDRILYFALLASHFVYAGLTKFLQLPAAEPPTPGNPIGTVLLGMSLCAAGAALALDTVGFSEAQIDKWIDDANKKFKDPGESAGAVRQRAVPLSLMRWSMASAASIFGLMTALTGSQPRNTALLLIAVAALVHLYCQPRLARVQARLDERLPKSGI